jgi:hypothetical protein
LWIFITVVFPHTTYTTFHNLVIISHSWTGGQLNCFNMQQILMGPPICAIELDMRVKGQVHNIIQTHSSVVWDWQYSMEHFSHLGWMWGIFSSPHFQIPRSSIMNKEN